MRTSCKIRPKKGTFNIRKENVEHFIWKIEYLNKEDNSIIDTQFHVKVSKRNSLGARIEKASYTSSLPYARKLRVDLEIALRKQMEKDDSLNLERFYFEQYRAELQRTRVRAGFENITKTIEGIILPVLGKLKLSEITAMDLEKFFAAKEKKSTSTLHNYRKILRGIFKQAQIYQYIERDPLLLMKKLPSIVEKKKGYLSYAQIRNILQYMKEKNHPYFLHFLVAVSTGMRVGEERGLLWKDIDFENRVLGVKRSFDARFGFSDCPKDRAERVIPLSPELYEVLLARKKELSPKPDDFVLPMLRKWRQREQCEVLRALCERCDYAVVRWHDLRSSFAVMLFMQNVPAIQIQDLLGHESLETTENYLRKLGVYLKGSTDGLSFFGTKDPSLLAYDRNKSSYFIEQKASAFLESGANEEIPVDSRLILQKELISSTSSTRPVS